VGGTGGRTGEHRGVTMKAPGGARCSGAGVAGEVRMDKSEPTGWVAGPEDGRDGPVTVERAGSLQRTVEWRFGAATLLLEDGTFRGSSGRTGRPC
jgi:hypothetical protein